MAKEVIDFLDEEVDDNYAIKEDFDFDPYTDSDERDYDVLMDMSATTDDVDWADLY